MEGTTYRIRFLNSSSAEGNVHAAELADHLRDAVPQRETFQVERERSNKDAQDFGATLVIILGTAAATAVAKGIQAWLAAHTGTRIEITDEKGRVVATNVDAASAAAITKAWTQREATKE